MQANSGGLSRNARQALLVSIPVAVGNVKDKSHEGRGCPKIALRAHERQELIKLIQHACLGLSQKTAPTLC